MKKPAIESIPTATAPEVVQELAVSLCHVSAINTRQPKPADVQELVLTIGSEIGQTTPALGRPFPGKPGHVEIAAGARRRVACEVLQRPLKIIVREMDDATFEEIVLVENLQREDPDPRAEATLLDRLTARGIATAEQISAHLGKPRHWVERRMQLLKVIPALRKQWESVPRADDSRGIRHFTVDMMELIGSLPPATQQGLTDRNQNWKLTRCTTRAHLSAYLKEHVACDLGSAPFALDDPRFFVKDCGPGCASDSSKQGALFDFGGKGKSCGSCLVPTCFAKRLALWNAAEYERLNAALALAGTTLPVLSQSYCAREIVIGRETIKPTHHYEVKTGKAPKGAKPVIVITDGGKLVEGYVPAARGGGSKSAQKATANPAEKLALRRAMCQGKRWTLVHAELLTALKESKAEDCTETIEELVAFFGLPHFHHADRTRARKGEPQKNKLWSAFDHRATGGYLEVHHSFNQKTKTHATRLDALWHHFKEVLEEQMHLPHTVSEAQDAAYDMERVAQLIGFPIAARKLEADKAVPPPKSWGAVDLHTLEPISAIETVKKVISLRKDEAKANPKSPKGSKLTAESRARIAAALKARWSAKLKAKKK